MPYPFIYRPNHDKDLSENYNVRTITTGVNGCGGFSAKYVCSGLGQKNAHQNHQRVKRADSSRWGSETLSIVVRSAERSSARPSPPLRNQSSVRLDRGFADAASATPPQGSTSVSTNGLTPADNLKKIAQLIQKHRVIGPLRRARGFPSPKEPLHRRRTASRTSHNASVRRRIYLYRT